MHVGAKLPHGPPLRSKWSEFAWNKQGSSEEVVSGSPLRRWPEEARISRSVGKISGTGVISANIVVK